MNGAIKSDVLIVGAGVIGLSLARELHRLGVPSVAVLEKGVPGRESSFSAAGMLAPQAEADSPDDFFRFCRASASEYPGFASELMDETGVDIEYDDSGTLYLAFSEDDHSELARRYEWQSASGLRVEYLSGTDTRKLEPFISPDAIGSLFFPDDRQVENRQLLKALSKYCELNEIRVFGGAEVKKMEPGQGEGATAVCADGRRFSASKAVLASGAWTSSISIGGAGRLPRFRPVRGQMVGFSAAKRLFNRVIYSHRGYVVPRRLGRIIAGSTTENAGFDNRITKEGIQSVLRHAYEISPSLADLQITEKWSGLRPYAEAGHPVIGSLKDAENVFIAAGHYRNGILLAPLTARILGALIVNGTESEFIRLFAGSAAIPKAV